MIWSGHTETVYINLWTPCKICVLGNSSWKQMTWGKEKKPLKEGDLYVTTKDLLETSLLMLFCLGKYMQY